jgi:type IV pilus assembly protein PilV
MTEIVPEDSSIMHRQIKITSNYGFSLMEVLIAMLVLAVGLLGVAALQANALKTNQSAYLRTQATFLAYDMIDRLRANRAAALAGEYELNMSQTPASSGPFAELDLYDWINNYVAQLLPAGDGSVTCANFGLCTVVVQWDESRAGGTAESEGADTIAQFSFTAEI